MSELQKMLKSIVVHITNHVASYGNFVKHVATFVTRVVICTTDNTFQPAIQQ